MRLRARVSRVVVGAALVLIPSRAVKRRHRAVPVRVQPCMSGESVAAQACRVTIAFNGINVRACGIAFVGAGAIDGRRSFCGCAWRWYMCAHFTRKAAVFLRMHAACLTLHTHTHPHTHTHTTTTTTTLATPHNTQPEWKPPPNKKPVPPKGIPHGRHPPFASVGVGRENREGKRKRVKQSPNIFLTSS